MSAGGIVALNFVADQKISNCQRVAQAAYVHPLVDDTRHIGQSSTVSRDAPKVGSIAARKTGRARIKERDVFMGKRPLVRRRGRGGKHI